VRSKDGTAIGYRQLGEGPRIVLMHGAMMSSHNLIRLGTALSGDFTIYIPDRHGRGMSGPYGPDFTLQRAAEDVHAVMQGTGARRIFALSAGAIAVLAWALDTPAEYEIALYEPRLPVNDSNPARWLARYDHEMSKGHLAAAMVTVAKETKDTRILQILPRAVAVPLMDFAMRAEAKQATTDEVPLVDLIPTMHYDAQLVLDAHGLIQASAALSAPRATRRQPQPAVSQGRGRRAAERHPPRP
jgi:pimeloyl-ACP methyl ester carboxylesterase